MYLTFHYIGVGTGERHSNVSVIVSARDSAGANITTGGEIMFLHVSK
jgi:hypothetical protein